MWIKHLNCPPTMKPDIDNLNIRSQLQSNATSFLPTHKQEPCVRKQYLMQFSIEIQVLEYKGQNEFWPLNESKVLTYSGERGMFAKQGRDGATADLLM
jgi:hypothetical protein